MTLRRFQVRPQAGVRFRVENPSGMLVVEFDDKYAEAVYQKLESMRDEFLSAHGGPVEVPESSDEVIGKSPTRMQPPKVGGGTTAMAGMLGTGKNQPAVPAGVRPPPPPKMQIPGGTQGGGMIAPIPGAPPAMPQPAILRPPDVPSMKLSPATPIGSVLPVAGQQMRPRPGSQAKVLGNVMGVPADGTSAKPKAVGNGIDIRPVFNPDGSPKMIQTRQGLVQETEGVVTGEPEVLPQPDILPPPPPPKGPVILSARGLPARASEKKTQPPVDNANVTTDGREVDKLEGDTLPSPAPGAE